MLYVAKGLLKHYLYPYYLLMKTLTEAQIRLLEMYSRKARVDSSIVIKAVQDWTITISEVSQWILGTKVL